jgi:hypothetical protein
MENAALEAEFRTFCAAPFGVIEDYRKARERVASALRDLRGKLGDPKAETAWGDALCEVSDTLWALSHATPSRPGEAAAMLSVALEELTPASDAAAMLSVALEELTPASDAAAMLSVALEELTPASDAAANAQSVVPTRVGGANILDIIRQVRDMLERWKTSDEGLIAAARE